VLVASMTFSVSESRSFHLLAITLKIQQKSKVRNTKKKFKFTKSGNFFCDVLFVLFGALQNQHRYNSHADWRGCGRRPRTKAYSFCLHAQLHGEHDTARPALRCCDLKIRLSVRFSMNPLNTPNDVSVIEHATLHHVNHGPSALTQGDGVLH
jgi:hypothetical protein